MEVDARAYGATRILPTERVIHLSQVIGWFEGGESPQPVSAVASAGEWGRVSR